MLINSIFRLSDVLLCKWTPQIYLTTLKRGPQKPVCAAAELQLRLWLYFKLNQSSKIRCAPPVRNYPTGPTQTKSPQVSINNQLKEVICTFEESLRTCVTKNKNDFNRTGLVESRYADHHQLCVDLQTCRVLVTMSFARSFFFIKKRKSSRTAAIVWSLQTVCQAHSPNFLL